MKFSDVIGHDDLKRRLSQQIDAGRISHAQLFSGAAGYGTLPLALAYVQYLFCPHRHDGDSCGVCPSCQPIASLAHPDLHFVFPVNKQNKKSGEVITSDMFLDLWRETWSESGGIFTPEEWYERLDLGKTMKGLITAKESEEIIRNRIDVYNAQTAIVADFYRAQNKFESVPSLGTIEEVAERIGTVVERYL